MEALLSRCVNVIRRGNGGRKGGKSGERKKKNLPHQRYLPNAWSRNTNTAPVMTETDRGKDAFGGVRVFPIVFSA